MILELVRTNMPILRGYAWACQLWNVIIPDFVAYTKSV